MSGSVHVLPVLREPHAPRSDRLNRGVVAVSIHDALNNRRQIVGSGVTVPHHHDGHRRCGGVGRAVVPGPVSGAVIGGVSRGIPGGAVGVVGPPCGKVRLNLNIQQEGVGDRPEVVGRETHIDALACGHVNQR